MRCFTKKACLEPRRRRRFGPAALMTAGILALGVAGAACGGGSSTPTAATHPTTTAVDDPSAGAGTPGTGLLAYSSCMRSNGVPNFPDPDSSGGIPKSAAVTALQAVSSAQAATAQTACKNLLPAGGSLSGQPVQTITAQQQQDYINAAACMRSHGITNFPDPSFQAGQVEFPMLQHLVNLNSPQFIQAYQVCRKLIPPGLPDSGSGS
jgi:hypothetical protein